jgi:hypothetical protein
MNNRIGNYHYVDGAIRTRKVRGTNYIIGIAAAYNAFGLIGPEHNGIFILDDDAKAVVLDRDTEEQSGYYGPSKRQWSRLEELMRCSEATFADLLAKHPRSRLAVSNGE